MLEVKVDDLPTPVIRKLSAATDAPAAVLAEAGVAPDIARGHLHLHSQLEECLRPIRDRIRRTQDDRPRHDTLIDVRADRRSFLKPVRVSIR